MSNVTGNGIRVGMGFASLALFAASTACGHKKAAPAPAAGSGDQQVTPPPPPVSTPLAGKINGAAWIFSSGEVQSGGGLDNNVLVNLYGAPLVDMVSGKPAAPCDIGAQPSDKRMLLTSVPKATGTYTGTDANNNTYSLTFVYPDATGQPFNDVGEQGQIIVSAVTSQVLTGSLTYRADDANQVSGNFTATICP